MMYSTRYTIIGTCMRVFIYIEAFFHGLWVDMGVRGKLWLVIRRMYDVSRSAVLLEEMKSASFCVEQGVVQGCSRYYFQFDLG